MAVSKLHILLISFLLTLTFTQITSNDVTDKLTPLGSDESDSFRIELDKLTSKIELLESLVYKKTEELRIKDDVVSGKDKVINEKEKLIREKSDSISLLKSEVASLKVKGSSDAKEQVQKANTRSQELEKQVEKLQLELDLKAELREMMETRSKELEKKMLEMNPKLQNLQQTIKEQKTKLLKTERALIVAEEELMKTKNEAAQKVTELTKVHSAWLPPWFAAQLACTQSYVEARWIEHGKPVLETFAQKALEKKAQTEKWAEPHIDTIKTKWIPAAKEQWVTVITTVEPHVQLATKRTKKFYVQSKEVVAPHVIKIKETVDPHFQVAKKFCKPYIDQVADATKPHLDKARKTIKPYMYGKFLESATKYHDQWIPAAKEHWVTVITTVEPHVQLATKRTKKFYVQSKEVVAPHVIKIKETVDPHFQVAKKFCKPYIDHVADATKPHLDKARETIKPYTYGKFLESATKYHDQFPTTKAHPNTISYSF